MRTTRLMLLALTGGLLHAAPFSMNGWQFHDYNIPKLEEAIKKAPEYGVNFYIFSHGLFNSVQRFLDSPEHQRDILRLGDLADKQKIPWYLWLHEFDDIPERYRVAGRANDRVFVRAITLFGSGSSGTHRLESRVNLDDPALQDYIRERYDRLLTLCPTSAGLVLTLHESVNKVFRDSEVASKLPFAERIYVLTKLIYDVVKKHNKTLVIRNFSYEPKEMEYLAQAIARLPDDVIVMSKDTTHEFHPFYPPDPSHGKVGKKRQIMELDLGVEKALGSAGLYAQTAYIRRYVQRARDTGLAGAVGRARLNWNHPFADLHEVNLYAFSRFMQDPNADVDAVLQDWVKRRYRPEAAPSLAAALKRTEFINHNGRYFLGAWMTMGVGNHWNDYRFYFGHTLLRTRYKWTQDPADKQLEQALLYPDRAWFDKLVAEKDEVLRQVRAGMADLRLAARYLTPEQSEPFQEGYRYLQDAAQLEKEWTRAYFAMRMWMRAPSEESAAIVRDALAELETMDRSPIEYGRDPASGHRYNIDKFADEMRTRMSDRRRALEEDASFLEEMVSLMDVNKN